jgi:hypothetical protein
MAFIVQPLDRSQDLLDLIGFGFALGILNIDPRVSLPGRFVDPMARAALARFAEVVIADTAGFRKPDSFGITPHQSDKVVNF